ncbi:hypothetical protein [Nonomuraea sp. NPDC049695]|uniref:hypothetical protein n=1 Tax=Nonomuraea sp. NPDC049695 TaxID=3154734 RepID=UPI003438D1F8
MQYVLVRQEFADYDTWRKAFDDFTERREAAGLRLVLVARNAANQNEIVVLFESTNADETARHAGSEALREAHRRGGVIEGSSQMTILLPAE